MFNLVYLLFFMISGIVLVTKHTDVNILTSSFATYPKDFHAIPVKVDVKFEQTTFQCDLDGLKGRDYERCAMDKMPMFFTTTNSNLSIWPGTRDIDLVVTMLCEECNCFLVVS